MALEFSSEARAKLKKTVARYPHAMAATLPALHLAQREFGHISNDVVELVAKELAVSPAHVWGVATFYTMFNKRPVAKYHLQVCTNVSCMLRGGNDLLKIAKEFSERRPELFTTSEVECLASCGTAVCVQINDDYHERLDASRARELFEDLARRG